MIQLVVAIAKNGVIGAGNTLPWRLPADLRHFRRLTMGHTLIMGRRTFDSIGKALPGRTTIVISRAGFSAPEGVLVVSSFEAALAAMKPGQEAFVVGGAEIYKLALPHADVLHLTQIDLDVAGDTWFPAWKPAEFELASSETHPADGEAAFGYELQRWVRRS